MSGSCSVALATPAECLTGARRMVARKQEQPNGVGRTPASNEAARLYPSKASAPHVATSPALLSSPGDAGFDANGRCERAKDALRVQPRVERGLRGAVRRTVFVVSGPRPACVMPFSNRTGTAPASGMPGLASNRVG